MFKCLNCGFVFVYPGYKVRSLPAGRTWVIHPSALSIPCCPKCKSDALKEVKD